MLKFNIKEHEFKELEKYGFKEYFSYAKFYDKECNCQMQFDCDDELVFEIIKFSEEDYNFQIRYLKKGADGIWEVKNISFSMLTEQEKVELEEMLFALGFEKTEFIY